MTQHWESRMLVELVRYVVLVCVTVHRMRQGMQRWWQYWHKLRIVVEVAVAAISEEVVAAARAARAAEGVV
jgi:hypothetical protein